MAKRSRSRRHTLNSKPRSLVELATRFEALAKEVQTGRALLASKEQELDGIREALAKATDPILKSAAGASRRAIRGGRKTSVSKGAKRARSGTLGDFITRAMADGHERSPSEVHAAVQKLGYQSKSNSSTQRVMVSQMLSKLTKAKALKNPGRARYVKA